MFLSFWVQRESYYWPDGRKTLDHPDLHHSKFKYRLKNIQRRYIFGDREEGADQFKLRFILAFLSIK
jgi:hypothetical protein